MLSVEAWTTIRYLQAQGMGIRAITRELSLSRKAVRRAASDNGDSGSATGREQEMDDLKSALDDLTAKVNRLVALQAEGRKPNQ